MTENKFAADVQAGLSKKNKELSSMYFYDAKGDELFMQIMELPEYYLTRAESEIFTSNAQKIIDDFLPEENKSWNLVELGAGDGAKTKILLDALTSCGASYTYIPIDISTHVLEVLKHNLAVEIPGVVMHPIAGDYFQGLEKIKIDGHHTVVLFLGSSIGNMTDEIAAGFLHSIAEELQPGDIIFLGADNIKAEEIVLPAYNDSKGITKAFNLNLLTRINKELDGNFNIENFDHSPEYNADNGIATSYIVSTCDQQVYIGTIDTTICFTKGEKIKTEISRKYNPAIIRQLISTAGLKIEKIYTDSKNLFNDYLLVKV